MTPQDKARSFLVHDIPGTAFRMTEQGTQLLRRRQSRRPNLVLLMIPESFCYPGPQPDPAHSQTELQELR